ncbi:MAG: lecithin retinol acyltransferase family protein [bacterium]|nr:lecithin retinol acyltransferase family protein [bacterium]
MARGDHISARRVGYSHHGIDCGDGTVIHYAGDHGEKRNPCVRRSTLAEFAKGAPVEVVAHRRADAPDIVVERAEGHVGEARYRLLRSNCEHFARRCATGKPRSRQVRRAATVAVAAVCGIAVATVPALRRRLRRG